MLRPRPGGFLYGEADLRVMRRDLNLLLDHGADGIALGVLMETGEINVARCRDLIAEIASAGREVVFHRAFDVTPDPFVALEQLVDLGVTRILTSGQQEGAYQGAALIAELIRRAAGRIEILPAGGINRFTLNDVVTRTGCDQVHASLTRSFPDASTVHRPVIRFGAAFRSPEDRFDGTDLAAVAEVVEKLRASPS
jgi:copper homeostasis protein